MSTDNNHVGSDISIITAPNGINGVHGSNLESMKTELKELKEVRDKQEDRIHKIQTSAFQLASYYFVFQGVVFSAISNATTLTCADKWYVIALSLVAAFLNLVALTIISRKYINAKASHDHTWSQCNYLEGKLSAGGVDIPQTTIKDRYTQRMRYAVMAGCLFMLLAFTAVMVAGAWVITCNHDKRRRQIYKHNSNSNCLRLCDGSNSCMIFCQTGLH